MAKLITTKADNAYANTESLRLMCEALSVGTEIVDELENFDTDLLDTFRPDQTITIYADIEYLAIWIRVEEEFSAFPVCSLNSGKEGHHWDWVLEYIGWILEDEMLKRGLNYRKDLNLTGSEHSAVPFP